MFIQLKSSEVYYKEIYIIFTETQQLIVVCICAVDISMDR